MTPCSVSDFIHRSLLLSTPKVLTQKFSSSCICLLAEIDLEDMALSHQPSTSTSHPSSNANNLQRRVNELEQALQLAQVQLVSRQEAIDKLFKEKYGHVDSNENVVDGGKDKGKIKDDAGYFDSYSGNGEPFFSHFLLLH